MNKKFNLIVSYSLELINMDIIQIHNWNVMYWHIN